MSEDAQAGCGPVRCMRPWVGFEVEHDGSVKPCCMTHVVCGNTNHQSIGEIWNGPVYREFRRKMAAGDVKDICRPDCPRLHGTLKETQPQPEQPAFAANYALNMREIQAHAEILESWPRFWKVTHSTLCNLDCIMCYQDRGDRRNLPSAFYGELAEHYQHMQEIELIGGEPLVIKNLRVLLRDFSKEQFPDVRFSIVTNGTVYDQGTQDLVRRANVSWMAVSLDAATPKTYEYIRRRGNFAKTLGGVRAWAALGRECNFQVSVAFTVMPENLYEIAPFVALAIDYGVDCLFGRVTETGGVRTPVDEAALSDQIREACALIDERGVSMPLAKLTLASITPATGAPM